MSPAPEPNSESSLREQLVHLIDEMRRARSHYEMCRARFDQLLPGTDINTLYRSDLDTDTVAEICLATQSARRYCTPEELVDVVSRIINPSDNEAEGVLLVSTFIFNCKHPAKSDLIFYPEQHFGGRANPTPEEIVAKALAK